MRKREAEKGIALKVENPKTSFGCVSTVKAAPGKEVEFEASEASDEEQLECLAVSQDQHKQGH